MSLLIEAFSRFVSELNEQAETLTPSELSAWAVAELARDINIDSSWYGWADLNRDVATIFSQASHNLPIDYYEFWKSMAHEDMLVDQFVHGGGLIASYYRDEPKQTDGMASLADKYDVNKIVTVMPHGRQLNRTFFLSAYRARSNTNQWNEVEKKYLLCAVDHISRAMRASWYSRTEKDLEIAVSKQGFILIGLQKFKEEYGASWPGWSGPELPHELHELTGTPGEHQLHSQQLIVLCSPAEYNMSMSFLNMKIRKMTHIDKLSLRELEVARTLALGLSHKEAARVLSISPSTVRNHTQSIYNKLGVDNRVALAQSIRDFGI